MKQKDVFKKIGGIIKELSDQYEYLETVTNDLNDLELELFAANAHFLTDHIEILCKLNLQKERIKRPAAERPEVLKPETSYQQKYFEPVVQQLKNAAGLNAVKPPVNPAMNQAPLSIKAAEPESAKATEPEFVEPVELVKDSPIEIEAIKAPEPELIKPAEPESPVETFKPEFSEPVEDNEPVASIDLGSHASEDTYSYTRQAPEDRPSELSIGDTSSFEPEHSGDDRTVTEPVAVVNDLFTPEPVAEPEPEIIPEPVTALPPVEAPESIKEPEHKEEEVLTVNQLMSAKFGDKSAQKTEQATIKPISDIKLAITLNDKLLYVKDLFNGYNLAYSEAIEILNRFNTFEEASRFLKTNYVTKNNWDSKPGTVEKFYALLKRRYA